MNSDSCNCDCGCGSLEGQAPPLPIENRPGLASLSYRVGTHAHFKQAQLSELSQHPEFGPLTTRSDRDPTIALLDGWSAILDVLTFYQERAANEQYLRTATERRSILELARVIGYELGPGVAASTHLAFTLERPLGATTQAVAASSPSELKLPIGTRAQSVPGQDELPQTFETVEPAVLRADWNALKARRGRRWQPSFGATDLYLAGTSTGLKSGDIILIVGEERLGEAGSERWDVRRLLTVVADSEHGVTRVTWAEGLGAAARGGRTLPAEKGVRVYALRTRAAIFGHDAQDWPALPDSLKADYLGTNVDSLTEADRREWPAYKIFAPASIAPTRIPPVATPTGPGPVLGTTLAAVAGAAAFRRPTPALTNDSIDLDNSYPGIVRDSWLILSKADWTELYQVAFVSEVSRAQFQLSGKVTRVKLSRRGVLLGELLEKFADAVRETTVFAESEELEIGDEPIRSSISGSIVELDSIVPDLPSGRLIGVTGTDASSGALAGEIAVLERAENVQGVTRLIFSSPLRRQYLRDDQFVLNANVVPATHGETTSEILGSGDGSIPFQSFALTSSPLTQVSAATARGIASTLEIRVDGIRWKEVPSLYGQPPRARVFTTRRADDGTTTVHFGDGVNGARLPTGQDNMVATYRHGLGTGGLVKPGQISLLMTRPVGLKDVVNPDASTGAADPEQLDDARSNAPLTVLTLDRIVSLQDHEDFARAFAGISKGRATLLWNGEQRLVHLTVAGVAGASVDRESALFNHLRSAIDLARHTDQEVRISSYNKLTFDVAARVKVNGDLVTDDVFRAITATLLVRFGFPARSFGQGLTSSEVIAVIQSVAGVEAVILEALHFTDRNATLENRLAVADAHWNPSQSEVLPADLLTLNPTGITLNELVGV